MYGCFSVKQTTRVIVLDASEAGFIEESVIGLASLGLCPSTSERG